MYSKGHYNEYKQFVPKNPAFELKDKDGLVIPENLDFDGIYRLSSCTYLGETTYPVDKNKPNCEFDPRYNVSYYMLFFENGRVLRFSTPSLHEDGAEYQLKSSDVSQKRAYISKDYWYTNFNANEIQMETFLSANGEGKYMISKAKLENEKLILPEKNGNFTDASIYTLVPFDKSLLVDFQIDW